MECKKNFNQKFKVARFELRGVKKIIVSGHWHLVTG